tara:strand:- start:3967 stop:4764 length:798 start_codon:yes stop_codon:yes gene_type:complete
MKHYYVLGNPINHSLSPKIFTFIFNKLNIHASYYTHMPNNLIELKSFLNSEIKEFNGLNITLPYKLDAYNLISEYDYFAQLTQSVNCIKNINNSLVGYNTDYYGFLKMLDYIDLNHYDILILGNGGIARTVAYALLESVDTKIFIWGRDRNNVDLFINSINSKNIKSYNKKFNKPCIVINCLSLTIDKNSIDMIINEILPSKIELFIDMNYTVTNMSQRLIIKKYNVILGIDMFIFQALKSFDIWFDNQYQNQIKFNELKNILSK